MQKNYIFALCAFVFVCIFSACSKSSTSNDLSMQKDDSKNDVQILSASNKASATPSVEEKALDVALSALNLPTKDLINANRSVFLNELTTLLQQDTDYLLVLVDKQHFLQEDYVPEDLVPLVKNSHYAINRLDLSLRIPVEKALCVMANAAKNDGITLLVSSTYRSYQYQKGLYERNVKQLGKEVADRESAMPGASQHQLGTAIDFGSITDDFMYTAQGKWLSNNAHLYGFSLSFPQNYEHVTGYRFECWHYRYIGIEACRMQAKWFNNVQQYMMELIDAYEKALANLQNA